MTKQTIPNTIYLARDMVYHNYKRCFSYEEGEEYIQSWSGKGYVEKYELNGDSYYFIEVYSVGGSKEGNGPIFGSQLYSRKVNISHAHVILV